MAKDDVVYGTVRVYDEGSKRVNWQNLRTEHAPDSVKCDKNTHYFLYGQKKCVCGKYDGSTPLELTKIGKK
jgi:hypothetical protein